MRERFNPTKRAEENYYRQILGAVKRYFADLLTAPEWLEGYANQAASAMVTHQLAENAKDWRAAAREAGEGRRIYEALQRELRGHIGLRYMELVRQNAQLIRSLPLEVAEEVTKQLARRTREGARPEAAERITLLSHVSRVRARLIARTEVSKAQAALTQARAEDLGLDWYVWETSEDQRVRPSHRKMQSVLVRFDDPPSPEALAGEPSTLGHYGAGNAPNCRCYSAPLLRMDQVEWPHKVYRHGQIIRATLSQFRRMNGIELLRAA
jgi:SPP1 gp7 family putative phage head morphogenesis protein